MYVKITTGLPNRVKKKHVKGNQISYLLSSIKFLKVKLRFWDFSFVCH